MKDEGYKNISRATHPPESQQKQKRCEPVTPFGLPLFWDAPAPRPDGSLINEGTKSKQEQGEPVAHINQNGVIHEAGYPWGANNTLEPLYRHLPQQRTWVGLTDDEIVECWARPTMWATAHAIEAKLKEKNT